jgi:hypothetical protein
VGVTYFARESPAIGGRGKIVILYATLWRRSRPFDPPETGKIAVKVINHYGDEVLKVFEVQEGK